MPDENDPLVNQKLPGDDIPFGDTAEQNAKLLNLQDKLKTLDKQEGITKKIESENRPLMPTVQAETISDTQKEIWRLQEENKRLTRKVRTYDEEEAIRAKGERQSAVSARDCFLAIIQGQAIRGDFTVGSPNFKGDISVATAAKNAAGVAAYMASAAKEARI